MSYLLFADDDVNMRQMVHDMMTAVGYDISVVEDGRAALASVRKREPDLLILDLEMPGLSGIEVCRALKGNPFTAQIPVLILTGRSGMDFRVEGFEAGADDYLSKPFDGRELRARVAALLRLVRREGDRNPTSGLPGATAIENEIDRLVRAGKEFVVCYADIDNFKAFADNFGFAAANDVIRGTARAMREALDKIGRPEDFLGHVGGDDFVILTDESRAVSVARASSDGFARVMADVLGADAVTQGKFLGRDREGVTRWLPLSRLSIAVLGVHPESWVSSAHLGARAAESKRKAKLKGPGTILLDVG